MQYSFRVRKTNGMRTVPLGSQRNRRTRSNVGFRRFAEEDCTRDVRLRKQRANFVRITARVWFHLPLCTQEITCRVLMRGALA